jgi:hypothetical protein
MDIEEQCSCRWVYASVTELAAVDDKVEEVGGGLHIEGDTDGDCDASEGGRVYWAIGRKELTGRLKELSCSGAPNHGQISLVVV